MAEVTKPAAANASLATILVPASCKISGLTVGEDIAQGDACYIKSDGKVWRSNGTAATAPAKVDGFADMPALVAQDQPITLLLDCEIAYANSLSPGARLYASAAVPGGLSTTATTGGTAPVATVISTKRIRVYPSRY